ncbi:hypothetical protein D3C72_2568400 [compost metagenome]
MMVTAAIPVKCMLTIARISATTPPYLQKRVAGRAIRLVARAPKLTPRMIEAT